MTQDTLLCLAASEIALAQSGGPYAITSNVVAGGGAMFSTGASNKLGGTIGQAEPVTSPAGRTSSTPTPSDMSLPT